MRQWTGAGDCGETLVAASAARKAWAASWSVGCRCDVFLEHAAAGPVAVNLSGLQRLVRRACACGGRHDARRVRLWRGGCSFVCRFRFGRFGFLARSGARRCHFKIADHFADFGGLRLSASEFS